MTVVADRQDPRASALRFADQRLEGPAGWRTQLPEPAHLWIRFSPRAGRGWRTWPGPDRPWLDLSRGGRPVWSNPRGRLPEVGSEGLDDVLYLPPVSAELETERLALAERQAGLGGPVLIQRQVPRAGELQPAETSQAGVTAVFDLLVPLLESDLDRLRSLPPGSIAIWPLLPGLTDGRDLWRNGCRRLSEAGVEAVQALSPALDPADRRRLAEDRDPAIFHALFHQPPPDPRAFAREAWRHRLSPFPDRPLPGPALRGRENRRVAGALALAAELWHRLGRPAARGQDLFRAAREIDRSTWDLAALNRDGNLGVLTWLSAPDRQFVEEALAGQRPSLLDELWREYLCDEP